MVLPALTSHVFHNHQGLSLYNVGFTCGIVGTFITAKLRIGGFDPQAALLWSTEHQYALGIAFFAYFSAMLALGWSERKKAPVLWRLPGTLATDFVSEQGFNATLFNMGLVALIGMGYILLVGGAFNGPTLGGVFTMAGFASFGKHVRNIWPVMFGVHLASRFSIWQPSDPGPLLAALFGTTLAPVAGTFGPIFGILAGFAHLGAAMHVGAMHAGMNLYHNGFAGGLVGTVFMGIVRWFSEGPQRFPRKIWQPPLETESDKTERETSA